MTLNISDEPPSRGLATGWLSALKLGGCNGGSHYSCLKTVENDLSFYALR